MEEEIRKAENKPLTVNKQTKIDCNKKNSYIFILCPPFCGSTLLWRLVSTSDTVSSLPWEGQFLPEVKEIMRNNPWDLDKKMPWEEIKKAWDRYWDYDKPLLLEKSPPNLIRAEEIKKFFNPIYFLIMVRNPYAHCEGLIRRWNVDATKAAEFAVHCLQQQAENARKLVDSLCFTYEDLVTNPESVTQRIQSFIPQVGKLSYGQKFKIHSFDGIVEREIINLNGKKIYNLSPKQLTNINKILMMNPEIMTFWGYEYYKSSLRHIFLFIKTRIEMFLFSIWKIIIEKVSCKHTQMEKI